MSVLWGIKKAGGGELSDVRMGERDGERDGFVFVASRDLVPDWIRLPIKLGGAQERVVRAVEARCPLCDEDARHLVCQTAAVAECRGCGFVWYRRSPSEP